jgi:hypothetical protein
MFAYAAVILVLIFVEASFMKKPTGSYTPFGLIVILLVILVCAFVIIGALYYNWKYNEAYVVLIFNVVLLFSFAGFMSMSRRNLVLTMVMTSLWWHLSNKVARWLFQILVQASKNLVLALKTSGCYA